MKTNIPFRCLLLGLFLASCTAASAAAFPAGSFSREDNEYSVLLFMDEGKFTYYYYGQVATSGTYSINGNELTWETDSICDELDAGKATYIWSYANDTLTFTLKGEDHCSERQEVLHQVAYVKQK